MDTLGNKLLMSKNSLGSYEKDLLEKEISELENAVYTLIQNCPQAVL